MTIAEISAYYNDKNRPQESIFINPNKIVEIRAGLNKQAREAREAREAKRKNAGEKRQPRIRLPSQSQGRKTPSPPPQYQQLNGFDRMEAHQQQYMIEQFQMQQFQMQQYQHQMRQISMSPPQIQYQRVMSPPPQLFYDEKGMMHVIY